MYFVIFLYEKCHSGSVMTFLGQFKHDSNKSTTGYTWTEGITTHLIFIYDFIIIGNMRLNVFLQ
jgi:hypothetical protein